MKIQVETETVYAEMSREEGTEARKHAERIRSIVQRTAKDMLEIGRRLIEVRNLLLPGTWGRWLETEFHWSQPVASNIMRAAARFADVDCATFFQPSAMYALIRNKVDPKAIDEAIEIARTGRIVSRKTACELVAKYLPDSTDHDARVDPVRRVKEYVQRASLDLQTDARKQLVDVLRTLADELALAAAGEDRMVRPFRQPEAQHGTGAVA